MVDPDGLVCDLPNVVCRRRLADLNQTEHELHCSVIPQPDRAGSALDRGASDAATAVVAASTVSPGPTTPKSGRSASSRADRRRPPATTPPATWRRRSRWAMRNGACSPTPPSEPAGRSRRSSERRCRSCTARNVASRTTLPPSAAPAGRGHQATAMALRGSTACGPGLAWARGDERLRRRAAGGTRRRRTPPPTRPPPAGRPERHPGQFARIRPATPEMTSPGRCCSPMRAVTTTRAPVNSGTSHCTIFRGR
jgi:hypothetical protein